MPFRGKYGMVSAGELVLSVFLLSAMTPATIIEVPCVTCLVRRRRAPGAIPVRNVVTKSAENASFLSTTYPFHVATLNPRYLGMWLTVWISFLAKKFQFYAGKTGRGEMYNEG